MVFVTSEENRIQRSNTRISWVIPCATAKSLYQCWRSYKIQAIGKNHQTFSQWYWTFGNMQIVFIWWTGRQETSVMITGPVLIVGAHSSLVFSLFDPPTFISSHKHCEDKILPHEFLGIHEILEAKSETASHMTTLGPRSPVVQGVIQYPLEMIKIFKRFYKPVRQNGCAV